MKRKIHLLIFALILTFSCGISECVAAQISGKLIDSRGDAVKTALVELIPADLTKKLFYNEVDSESTNDNGEFVFENIADGKYILAINYVWSPNIDDPYPTTFYPTTSEKSQAFVFEVNSDKTIPNVIFQLPEKLAELTVAGKVLLKNGKPAVDVHVRLENEEYEPTLPVSDCRTDENGNFLLKGFVGGKYHITTDNYKMDGNDWAFDSSKPFVLERNLKGFRLILKSVKEKLEKPDKQPDN